MNPMLIAALAGMSYWGASATIKEVKVLNHKIGAHFHKAKKAPVVHPINDLQQPLK